MIFNQSEYDIKCEWGLQGVQTLAPICDVLIIVDVITFSTRVEIAVARGAMVYPYAFKDGDAEAFASSIGGVVADIRSSAADHPLNAVQSLLGIAAGTRIVLPSPNGAALSLAAGAVPTLAGCMRNAKALADAASQIGQRIGVIAAGERWRTDGSLRPSLEDWLGAGAIIRHLAGSRSPEAWAAVAGAEAAIEQGLGTLLMGCASGKELVAANRSEDVRLCAMLDVSGSVPILRDRAYGGG